MTKERIRDILPHCRYAHLATHGSFSSEHGTDSAFDTYGVSAGFDSFLVLADANRSGVDALMTAGEIESLDLPGASSWSSSLPAKPAWATSEPAKE